MSIGLGGLNKIGQNFGIDKKAGGMQPPPKGGNPMQIGDMLSGCNNQQNDCGAQGIQGLQKTGDKNGDMMKFLQQFGVSQ